MSPGQESRLKIIAENIAHIQYYQRQIAAYMDLLLVNIKELNNEVSNTVQQNGAPQQEVPHS